MIGSDGNAPEHTGHSGRGSDCESRRCQPRTKAGRLIGIAKTRPPPPSFTDRGRPRRPVRRVLSTVESLTVKLAEAWQAQSFLTHLDNTPADGSDCEITTGRRKTPAGLCGAPDGGGGYIDLMQPNFHC